MKTEIVDIIKANLTDIRIAHARLLLEDLFIRKNDNDFIPKYRVYIKGTETPVKDMTDFITQIKPTDVEISAHTGGNSSFSDKVSPIKVTVNNLEVRLILGSEQDVTVTMSHGAGADTINFILNYCNDGDPVLPLKIIGVTVSRRK